MSELQDDIAAYDAMRAELETAHLGKWVIVHDRKLVGTYESFDAAAENAVGQFGRGPYLIRQVGTAPVSLPASLLYRLVDA
jgi:hypothetical protein